MLTGCQLVLFIPLISKSFLALQLHLYQSVRPVYLGHFVPLMQKLETGMADLVCLDGRRITSKGITSGSNSFRVTALAEAACCFGSSAQAEAANTDGLQQQVWYQILHC